MANLCCVLNDNKRHGVICRECSQKWECWCAWREDRTHRTAVHFTTCPLTGKKVEWDRSSIEDGVTEYIRSSD